MTALLLAGPTAVGKTAVAIELALRLGGEIVSVDSMQVYRGLNIGTAKPTKAERELISHHLVDEVSLDESFDAARFVATVQPVLLDIQERGKLPILCGGTGLYFNAWLNGLGAAPAPNPELRSQLEALPLAELLDELARTDLVTFDQIDIENRRRVVRAVEVIRLTGKPFSSQRANWPDRAPTLAGRSFGLRRTRLQLRQRIDARVDAMFRAGLIEETRSLLQHGLQTNRTAQQALGYRQVMEHFSGVRGRLETIELVKVRTRQFAKRQHTWFENQMDLHWLDVTEEESPGETALRIIRQLDVKKDLTSSGSPSCSPPR